MDWQAKIDCHGNAGARQNRNDKGHCFKDINVFDSYHILFEMVLAHIFDVDLLVSPYFGKEAHENFYTWNRNNRLVKLFFSLALSTPKLGSQDSRSMCPSQLQHKPLSW